MTVSNPGAIARRHKAGGSAAQPRKSPGASAGRSPEWTREQLERAHRCVDLALSGIEGCLAKAKADGDDAALVRIARFFLDLGLDLHLSTADAGSSADRSRVVADFLGHALPGGSEGPGGLRVDGDEPQDPGQVG